MYRASSFNYSDITPQTNRDLNFINGLDIEEFALFGVSTIYYKVADQQDNFDPVFRDLLSSKRFEDPIQLRSFFKLDEETKHGMTDTGADQTAEREGKLEFNCSLIESILKRPPVLGDVVENVQAHQKFEIFHISKQTHRLGVPIRYICKVRLYQGSL